MADVKEATIADVKAHFAEYLKRVGEGEQIVVTRRGKPVALITRPPEERKPKLGTLAGTIELPEGWDAPMTDEEFDEFINHGNL